MFFNKVENDVFFKYWCMCGLGLSLLGYCSMFILMFLLLCRGHGMAAVRHLRFPSGPDRFNS